MARALADGLARALAAGDGRAARVALAALQELTADLGAGGPVLRAEGETAALAKLDVSRTALLRLARSS